MQTHDPRVAARAPKLEGPTSQVPAGPALVELRGQDLNLRPSGYERDFTQPADGRRPSCFQFLRAVGSNAVSTEVHARMHESPLVWTRSGQSLRPAVLPRESTSSSLRAAMVLNRWEGMRPT